jgi:rod shape-determining protein MreD
MAAPAYTGVVMGWALGLFLDVLAGALLGQHALALAIVAFVAHRFHRQVRVLPVWQQGVGVFGLVFIYQALILWITGIQGMPIVAAAYWSSPLVSMLLWPWIYIVLRDVRRRYLVA